MLVCASAKTRHLGVLDLARSCAKSYFDLNVLFENYCNSRLDALQLYPRFPRKSGKVRLGEIVIFIAINKSHGRERAQRITKFNI